MTHHELDPSIKQFKRFVNQYPRLCADIHSKNVSIQSVYEKWMKVGEDDAYWDTFNNASHKQEENNASTEQTGELIQTIMDATKNMDMNKVQSYVEQVSAAVQSVQEIVESFKKTKESPHRKSYHTSPKNDFFRRMRD